MEINKRIYVGEVAFTLGLGHPHHFSPLLNSKMRRISLEYTQFKEEDLVTN